MQLHRHHITAVSFASALEKVAKVTPQDILREEQSQGALENLRASTDPYSSAKAFAKGMGVSFAVPLALGLGSVDTKTLMKQVEANTNRQIDTFYIKQGLLEGGAKNADDLAPMIVRSNQTISVPGSVVIPDYEIKNSFENAIKKELDGSIPQNLTKNHSWTPIVTGNTTVDRVNQSIAQGKSIDRNGVNAILSDIQQIHGVDAAEAKNRFNTMFKEPTAQTIIAKDYASVGRSGSLLDTKQFTKLYDVGTDRAKRLGLIAPSQKKLERDFLKKFILSRSKAPLALGVLGGISAVMNNRKKQSRYKNLLKEVEKRNAR